MNILHINEMGICTYATGDNESSRGWNVNCEESS